MENKDIEKEAAQVFDDATKDTGAVLMNPGSEGLYVHLATIIETLTEELIIESLSRSNWAKDRNFTKSEFLSLALFLAEESKKTEPGDDDTEPGAEVSKQPVSSEAQAEEVPKTDAVDEEAKPGADALKQQVSSESVKQALEGVLHCISDKNAQEELREAISDILKAKLRESSFEIESFRNLVEKKWTDFWTELPELARVNDQVMKQQWLKKEVIDILLAFLAPDKNSLIFTPKIRPDELDTEDERQRAMASLKHVAASHVAEVEAAWKEKFESECKSIPKFVLDANLNAIEKNWLKQNYYAIVAEVGHRNAQNSFVFVPPVDPSSLGNQSSEEAARRLIKEVQVQHVGKIETAVAEEYADFLKTKDEHLYKGIEKAVKKNWLERNYFEIVSRILTAERNRNAQSSFAFVPAVDPSSLGIASSEEAARRLIKEVQEQHVEKIATAVANEYANFVKTQDEHLYRGLEEEVKENWLKMHYFEIVSRIVTEERQRSGSNAGSDNAALHSCGSAAKSSSGNAGFVQNTVDVSSDTALSPMRRKKARLSPPEAASVLIGDVHTTAKVGDVCHISGAVLYCGDEVRCCDTKNPTTNVVESTAVLNLSIGDTSGVVQVTFWRDAAVNAYALLDKVLDAQSTSSCVKIAVSFLVVKNPRNASLPLHSVRVLHSTERTTLKIEGSIALSLVPDSRIAITDFRRLKAPLPYTVHLRGVVVGQADPRVTQKGVEQIGFSLMDRQRRSVQCLAHDVSVDPNIFTEGTEVMIFYAVGMAGRNSEGSIWLYSDSYIMRVGRAMLPGTPIEEIRIGA